MIEEENNLRKKPFLKFIAYLQITGIILVVLGHSFHQYPDGNYGKSLLVYRMMYNFRMPLFMFVSGFLLVYTALGKGKLSVKRFVSSKLRRLMLPYFVLTFVTYLPRVAMSQMADERMGLSLRTFLQIFYSPDLLVIPYYWFLQASFLLLVAVYGIFFFSGYLSIPRKYIFPALLIMFLGVQFIDLGSLPDIFSWRHALELSIYFILGMIYCEYYDRITRYLSMDNIIQLLIFATVWAIMFIFGEDTYLSRISSLFGIGMCICVSKLLVRYNVMVFDHLIGANYMIFLLSWYFNVLFQQVLSYFVNWPWWIHSILSLIFGIYIPWLGYEYLKRHQHIRTVRIISTLLGQSLKPKTPSAKSLSPKI